MKYKKMCNNQGPAGIETAMLVPYLFAGTISWDICEQVAIRVAENHEMSREAVWRMPQDIMIET